MAHITGLSPTAGLFDVDSANGKVYTYIYTNHLRRLMICVYIKPFSNSEYIRPDIRSIKCQLITSQPGACVCVYVLCANCREMLIETVCPIEHSTLYRINIRSKVIYSIWIIKSVVHWIDSLR